MNDLAQARQSNNDFPDGVAVVVGGSGGIGNAICMKLAESGANVVFTYRNNKVKAESITNSIKALGLNTESYSVAIEHEQEVTKFFSMVIEKYKKIHTIINATGSNIPMLFINQLSPEKWREVMDKDANGFFNIVHASLPHMREHSGSYVVISTAGLKRWPTRDVLSVAPKAAIDALVTGIAREEGKFGVRANTVALGLIDAGIFQRLRGTEYSEEYVEAAIRNSSLKRLGTADEVADSVGFFASNRARFVTGQTLVLDGGFSL